MTLFPNGYPGPPSVIPTAEEQITLKDDVVQLINECVPRAYMRIEWLLTRMLNGRSTAVLSPILLGPSAAVAQETVAGMLEPLSSDACNAHLVLQLFDLVLVTLFPELGVPLPNEADAGRRETGGDEMEGSESAGGVSPRVSMDEREDSGSAMATVAASAVFRGTIRRGQR